MKRILVLLAIVVVVAVTFSSVHAEQKSIAGTWTFKIPELLLRMVLVQKGKKITGTLQNPHSGGPINLKGEFSGGQLKVTGSSKGGEFEYQISATGVLQRDGSLAGSLTSNVGDMMWTAVRANAK